MWLAGRVYVPEDNPNYRADGLASWYGEDFHGRLTANGEVFDLNGISAAHPTLPLPCYARVTNLSNGRSIIVRVNDRGPYHGNRIIDVSVRTAQLLGFQTNGTAWVRVEYVGRAPLAGSDDRVLAATLRQDEPAPLPNSTKFAAAKPIVPAALAPVERGPRLASASTDDTVVAAPAAGVFRAAASARERRRPTPQRPRALLNPQHDVRLRPCARPIAHNARACESLAVGFARRRNCEQPAASRR